MRGERERGEDDDEPEAWKVARHGNANGVPMFTDPTIPKEPALKTRRTIRANRDIIMNVFGVPDEFVEEYLGVISKRIPPHA